MKEDLIYRDTNRWLSKKDSAKSTACDETWKLTCRWAQFFVPNLSVGASVGFECRRVIKVHCISWSWWADTSDRSSIFNSSAQQLCFLRSLKRAPPWIKMNCKILVCFSRASTSSVDLNYIHADLYIFKFLQLNRILLELEEIKWWIVKNILWTISLLHFF